MLPFNRPHLTGNELRYMEQAVQNAHLSGNGPFSARCTAWLERHASSARALLTHSCTGALEMAALLSGVGPGDEVIMPSFTFASTANAFVLRGAVPVFVEVRHDTLNLDESLIEEAITPRTKVIVPVHYAGVACEMDAIEEIAKRRGLLVVADAAQGVMATYRGRALAGLGALAAMSFHETKNVMCGEGGALIVNDAVFAERAEILHEKGTDRRRFQRREVARYSWVDVGSSFAASDLAAAFLWAQLEQAEQITAVRLRVWGAYHDALAGLERAERLRRPVVPAHCSHNAHLYHVLLPDHARRDALLRGLDARGINAVFHYVPLHSSRAGIRYGRAHGDLSFTEEVSARLVRLPLWADMTDADVARVAEAMTEITRV